MTQEQHHEELVTGITAQLKPVMDKSPQAMFVYLDDTHKACNKKFADLLGYKSVKEWEGTEAPLADVAEDDQDAIIAAYEAASEQLVASSLDVRFINTKTQKPVKAKVIMVPVPYNGHIFAVHFISKL